MRVDREGRMKGRGMVEGYEEKLKDMGRITNAWKPFVLNPNIYKEGGSEGLESVWPPPTQSTS